MVKLATIAGSDASGGAGLEADLKTFEEYGTYGMTAVTLVAVMDPDKEWSHAVFPLAENVIRAQLETIFKGIMPNAVKTGMLATPYAVELSAEYIKKYKVENYVLDPVMVCKGAGQPLTPELNELVIKCLLPKAKIITPNLFEAGQITGMDEPSSIEEMKEAAKRIHGLGVPYVFIKGGSKIKSAGFATDVFYDGKEFILIEAELIDTKWTHGAGCTTAAAITAGLGLGLNPLESVKLAKIFITASLKKGFALNKWVGPGNPSGWRDGFLKTSSISNTTILN